MVTLLTGFVLALASAAPATGETVRLVVDYGDGVSKVFKAITWTKGMTVEDLLKEAKKTPHGITYDAKGIGSSFLVKKIDDLVNEGSGADKKSWQYWVNTEYADVGAGTKIVQPDDVVTWRFDIYRGAKN